MTLHVPGGQTLLQTGLSGQATLVAGIALAVLLTTVAVLTIGYSVAQYLRRKRRAPLRDDLREELLTRLYRPSGPEWEQWVGSLSERERSVLESLLEEYLRELAGEDAETLAGLGDALGVTHEAHLDLRQGSYYDRLHALTWLGLLRDPPSPGVLEQHCTGTPRERAAAVRVLYESDHPDIESLGVDLLLRENTAPFSIFGVDTLYRAAQNDPASLFARADADFETWEPPLQQQVLLACRHLRTLAGDAELRWLADALYSSDERTRAEAAATLGGFDWHRGLYESVDVQRLVSDPSPLVRKSAYRMLGEWGTDRAVTALRFAGMTDSDARTRVAAAQALVEHRDDHEFIIPQQFSDAWSWACAHAEFDEIVRDVSSGTQRPGSGSQTG